MTKLRAPQALETREGSGSKRSNRGQGSKMLEECVECTPETSTEIPLVAISYFKHTECTAQMS